MHKDIHAYLLAQWLTGKNQQFSHHCAKPRVDLCLPDGPSCQQSSHSSSRKIVLYPIQHSVLLQPWHYIDGEGEYIRKPLRPNAIQDESSPQGSHGRPKKKCEILISSYKERAHGSLRKSTKRQYCESCK